MALLPFGEWLPDQPDFDNPGASIIRNVYPRTQQSYGPLATPVAYSGALTARCQGAYSVRDNGGNVYNFAGDASKLYLLKSGSTSYVNVSKGGGSPYTVAGVPNGFWSATSFGVRVIFTDGVDNIQTFLVGTDTAFSDLASAAPKASYCAVTKDFLMVGNTTDGVSGAVPRRLWWSAIGDPLTWPTPGSAAAIAVQSDFQDLQQTDLGDITGLVGGHLSAADGAAFCQRGIYRIIYVGSPLFFDFTVAQGAAGTLSPLSIVERRLRTFGVESVVTYLGEDGFYAFDGATTLPIGAQKVDRTFFNDLDPAYLGYVQGIADPISKLIFWAYHGPANGGFFNRLLVYNWDLSRWALADISATPLEWLTQAMSIGYTLDQLDQVSTSLDALPFSLDSQAWTGGNPLIAMFDNTHKLNFTTGPNMAPTVETGEKQLFPGRRAMMTNTRPFCDAAGASISVGHRELLSNAVTYEAAIPANIIGDCPQRITGRYARFRLTLPANTTFNHLQGIDVKARPEGALR